MKDNVPSKSYTFFINLLLQTIRSEIASCMEKAYEQISLKDCAKMLQLDSKDASKLIKERGWTVRVDSCQLFVYSQLIVYFFR